MIKFTSWSPSRLADYEQCPLMAKLKHLDKLCPICFKGRTSGGFDSPMSCDTCGGTVVKSDALERGTAIGQGMEKYLKSEVVAMPLEVASQVSRKIAANVRKAVKAAKARIEYMITLDRDWKPTTQFSKSAWLRAKMDVTMFQPKNRAHVIDWKTGGVDRKTGEPRSDPKYDDQLSIYTTAVMSSFATINEATASLVFLDATENPVVEREKATLKRSDLEKRQAAWSKKLLPMMNDDVFAPLPSNKCNWCPYSKKKGGPCAF